MYELFLNGKFTKSYASLKGVKIAYGRYLKMFDRGEIPILVPDHTPFIEWKLVK